MRRTTSSADVVLQGLATELLWATCHVLRSYGLSAEQLRLSALTALKARKVAPVSGRVLRDYRAMGNLVFKWMCDSSYVDDAGRPRILPLHGRRPSFGALAKQFFPGRPLREVLKLAYAAAEIEERSGRRVALIGGCTVDLAGNPEATLAHSVRHVIQLLSTGQHNFSVAQKGHGIRWTDRMVNRVIEAKSWDKVVAEIRPQLADLIDRTDRLLQPQERAALRSRQKKSVVGVGVYLFQEDAIQRAGVENRGT
jgi:hypothetical protein